MAWDDWDDDDGYPFDFAVDPHRPSRSVGAVPLRPAVPRLSLSPDRRAKLRMYASLLLALLIPILVGFGAYVVMRSPRAANASFLDGVRALLPTPLPTITPTLAPTLTPTPPPPPTATPMPSRSDRCVDTADQLIIFFDGQERRLPDYIFYLALINSGIDTRRVNLNYGCSRGNFNAWLERHRPK